MSWLLLLLGVVGVVHAANALAPRKGPTLVFAWSFMASWITIELVWHHLFFGALATGLLVYFGALDEPAGVLGLVLMAITGVLLLVIGFSTGKTRVTMHGALVDLEPEPSAPRYPRSHVVLPFLVNQRKGVRRLREHRVRTIGRPTPPPRRHGADRARAGGPRPASRPHADPRRGLGHR